MPTLDHHPLARAGDASLPGFTPLGVGPVYAAQQVIETLFGPVHERHFAVEYWDGKTERPPAGGRFTLILRHPAALRRMLFPPSEVALVRAYLDDHVDIAGDIEAAAPLADLVARRLRSPRTALRLARAVLALAADDESEGHRPPRAARAARGLLRFGRAHASARDARAVRFHYDVGNDFYALWLDQRMVYSCGYFPRGDERLETGQEAKLDYVCCKLRLRPGERFLDIGCGWGALPIHAARHYGVHATGITLSEEQARLARERVRRAQLEGRVTIEVRDYRTLADPEVAERFDKIASVGMVEHVGARRLDAYFAAAWNVLRPGGLFLNHGIVSIAAARPRRFSRVIGDRLWGRGRFINEYVFPDGELLPSAVVIGHAERNGFELRDVESLREHYVTTLRHWLTRLEANAESARAIVGEGTFRVWRLYMAASAHAFRTGRIGIIQSLLAKARPDGGVRLPRSRADLYLPA